MTIEDSYGAIFVDASRSPQVEKVQVLPIELDELGKVMIHHTDPRSLLCLCQSLYSYYPRAWLVKVPAIDFELGDRLFSVAQQDIFDALDEINCIIRQQTHHQV